MPGIVVFRRRWSVGSDDLVVPGVFLLVLHLIWVVVLSVLLGVVHFDHSVYCILTLWEHILGYLAILAASLLVECAICAVALRGSILDTDARASMQYLLYVRLGVMVMELIWLILGVVWLVFHYQDCPIEVAKEAILGIVICNWCVLLSVIVTVWCTYDVAGRSWVKMKKYQQSMKESESRFQYKRSANNRNWRQRKVIRAYQDSWDHRCRLLFCCMRNSDRNRNSFADIARLLSDFFRDLDVVPSDVVAGLVLLRKFQKIEREAIVRQRKNDTYEFLSGVAVTSNTQFLSLNDPDCYAHYQAVVHYMHFALGAYGWPMFLITNSATGICQLCARLRCSCFPCIGQKDPAVIIKDNCCQCNYAALRKLVEVGEVEVVYATYHVDVGETPFFVAVDYSRRKIVISIRGTLSMKDVITDLNAEGEPLPLNPPRDDWLGHKGMVLAAEYIREKLKEESILQTAFQHNVQRETPDFELVLVGHSLGAGTAAILAILLRQEYPTLQCFSYSPPGGSLSMPAVEYTKSFITSVVVGKDVVPRIGLHQLESLRADLINTIKRSKDPKWKTIVCSAVCCGCHSVPTSAAELQADGSHMDQYQVEKDMARDVANIHPSDSSIALTVHQPLYPPGRIIHIVRHHPTPIEQKYEKRWRQVLNKHEPVYQAVWANNTDFDEVLISPVMIQDHMPDNVLEALNKVITCAGPAKPQRTSTDRLHERYNLLPTTFSNLQTLSPSSPKSNTPPHKLCLETSFTSLQSPGSDHHASLTSSLSNGHHKTRSQGASPFAVHPSLPWEYSTLLDEEIQKGLNYVPPKKVVKKKVDLIHDDWFGLAPIASPESLSEVSSISSRASSLMFNIKERLRANSASSAKKTFVDTNNVYSNLTNDLDALGKSHVDRFAINIMTHCSSGEMSYKTAQMSSGETFKGSGEGSGQYESAHNGSSEEDILRVTQFSSADSITVNADVHYCINERGGAEFFRIDALATSSPKQVKFSNEQDSVEENDSPLRLNHSPSPVNLKTSRDLGKLALDVGKLDGFRLDHGEVCNESFRVQQTRTENNNVNDEEEYGRLTTARSLMESLPLLSDIAEREVNTRKYVVKSVGKGESSV